MSTDSLRAVIASLLNASQIINMSTRGWGLKRFEQSQRLDTALYKNVP